MDIAELVERLEGEDFKEGTKITQQELYQAMSHIDQSFLDFLQRRVVSRNSNLHMMFKNISDSDTQTIRPRVYILAMTQFYDNPGLALYTVLKNAPPDWSGYKFNGAKRFYEEQKHAYNKRVINEIKNNENLLISVFDEGKRTSGGPRTAYFG